MRVEIEIDLTEPIYSKKLEENLLEIDTENIKSGNKIFKFLYRNLNTDLNDPISKSSRVLIK